MWREKDGINEGGEKKNSAFSLSNLPLFLIMRSDFERKKKAGKDRRRKKEEGKLGKTRMLQEMSYFDKDITCIHYIEMKEMQSN